MLSRDCLYLRLLLTFTVSMLIGFRCGVSKASPSWEGLSRYYIKTRPFVIIRQVDTTNPVQTFGGVITDAGVEVNTRFGLRLGVELAPITFSSARAYMPLISARIQVGYANEFVGISLAVGGGLSWIYPQLGPMLRIGRFTGVHALVRILWSIYPPVAGPVNFDIEGNVPVGRRVRLNANLGGGYGNLTELISIYATAGVQVLISGQGGQKSQILTTGLGAGWMFEYFGPVASVGFAQHF